MKGLKDGNVKNFAKFGICLWFVLSFFTMSIQPIHAVRFIVYDSRYFVIERVCHDGANVVLINFAADTPPPSDFEREWSDWFDVNLYTSESIPDSTYDSVDLVSGDLPLIRGEEHPLLLNDQYYSATEHNTLYSFPFEEERPWDTYVYGAYTMMWPEYLPEGTLVVFDEYISDSVRDCYIDERVHVSEETSTILNEDDINSFNKPMHPDYFAFEIISLPDGANAYLNSSQLDKGEFFNQDNINSGEISLSANKAVEETYLEFVARGTSVASGILGTIGNQRSWNPSITSLKSVEGSDYSSLTVSFQTDASNLTYNDTNNQTDVYAFSMYRFEWDDLERVSVTTSGVQGSDLSRHPKVSMDGEFIVFESEANLLNGNNTCGINDVNNQKDIYATTFPDTFTSLLSIKDWFTCEQYSTPSRFGSRPVLVGRDVFSIAYTNNNQVYLLTITEDGFFIDSDLISSGYGGSDVLGNGLSAFPDVSYIEREFINANGNWEYQEFKSIVYHSTASNLVQNDGNNVADVFLRTIDIENSTISNNIRISEAHGGGDANGKSQAASVSNDGRYIAFRSEASNLLDPNEELDTNGTADIFVFDRGEDFESTEDDEMIRVSVWATGSQMNGTSSIPEMSANGRYIAFRYAKANVDHLPCGDTGGGYQIYVHDRDADNDNIFDERHEGAIRTYRASVNNRGEFGNEDACSLSISPDGSYVAFSSYATNLVDGVNTNGVEQVYVHHQFIGRVPISVEFSGPADVDEWKIHLPFIGYTQ